MENPIFVRGVSGSGKTTFAVENFPNRVLVEADQFFLDEDNNYNFDPSRLKDAHEWCFNTAKKFAEANVPCIVANTFTREWELAKYLEVWPNAKIYRMTGEFENTHGVPQHAVDAMKNRFEDIDGEIVV